MFEENVNADILEMTKALEGQFHPLMKALMQVMTKTLNDISEQPPGEGLAAEMARCQRKFFEELKATGFNEEQAIEILKSVNLTNSLAGAAKQ